MLKELNKFRKDISPSIIPAILPSLSTFAVINASVFSGYIAAQNATIEEVVVTARKKTESLQDVPLSVSALNEETLEERGINVFEDYLLQLPGVTAGGSGPGQSTIYIRGLASTTPNLTTAGVAGLAPNVGFYLDEQPLAQPGRNLDVYAADINRIEVLAGPQGTLFGASSQAGVVRLITNKPKPGVFESNVEFETRFMPEGDTGTKAEFMTNIPISDSTTWRFVGYKDRRGGYIDQVPGTLDASSSGSFRAAGTVRDNGLPVSVDREGRQGGADLSGVIMTPTSALEEDNVNGTEYVGFRSTLAQDIGENFKATLVYAEQTIEADGVFFTDPGLGDLEIQRYSDDYIDDEYSNMSLTLEGSIGDLEVVYAGAYTDRETNQVVDYTDYLFVGDWIPYYICDYYVTYTTFSPTGAPFGTCGSVDLFVDSTTDTSVETHEVRVNAPINDTMSLTAGLFKSDTELKELNLFTYPGSLMNDIEYASNYALTDVAVTGTTCSGKSACNAGAGWYSAGPFPEPVIFFNDIRRTDSQKGVFGELNIAMSDTTELTVGARWYDIEVDFEGSANSSFGNGFGNPDEQRYGTNLSVQYAPGNPNGYPDKAKTDGVIGKVTYSWRPKEDVMYYVTWSEGFRPGLLNRPVGAGTDAYRVKPEVESDEITNMEFGWKTILLDGQLRLNGSIFNVDVEGLQSTILDPAMNVNLFFSDNAADGTIRGLEGDFTYLTDIDGLSVAGAFSFLDSEITKKLLPTNDVIVGENMAFAPEYQGNIRIRQEFGMSNGYVGHGQIQMVYSGESTSDIMEPNKATQDSYSYLDIRVGMSNDDVVAELYIDNVTDKRAEISNNFVFDRQRVTVIKPLTVGIRVKKNF